MRKIRRFSWIFCITTKKNVHRFVLKDTYLYVLVAVITSLFLSTSFLSIAGIGKRSLYSEFQNQLGIRQRYITSLEELSKEIDILKENIDVYSGFDDRLRYLVDVSPLERELRVRGIGGPSMLDTLKGKLSKSSYNIVSELVKEVNFAERLVDLERTSYEQIYNRLISIIDLRRHTPSIWPAHGYITSGFGYRRHPIMKYIAFHRGIDIANFPGTPIYATADGVVDFTGWQAGYGNYISIDHGYGLKTKYGHLLEILVEGGQEVKRGDIIATMGSSGVSTGPHLQYEVRVLNKPVNPISYIIRDTLTY